MPLTKVRQPASIRLHRNSARLPKARIIKAAITYRVGINSRPKKMVSLENRVNSCG